MTYDLLPEASVLSFLQLQFPRMAFLVLVLWVGKQRKGRGKRLGKEAEEQGGQYPGERVLHPQLYVDRQMPDLPTLLSNLKISV